MALTAYLLLGAVAGVSAGLLGIGGGLIVVPALLLIWQQADVASSWLMQMAIATSLASVAFTSMSSVWAHHRRGTVQWSLFRRLVPGIVLGAGVGALLASGLPSGWLKTGFGFIELLVALQMAFRLRPQSQWRLPGRVGMTFAGGLIGWLSALMGIGGGTLTVPFLVACKLPIQQAVATSAACGLPIAVAGSLMYVFSGWGMNGLPDHTVGLIYWPALLAVVSASVVFAPLGARLAHRLPALVLQRVFVLFLALLGLSMLLA